MVKVTSSLLVGAALVATSTAPALGAPTHHFQRRGGAEVAGNSVGLPGTKDEVKDKVADAVPSAVPSAAPVGKRNSVTRGMFLLLSS